jgi:hypothetical protein
MAEAVVRISKSRRNKEYLDMNLPTVPGDAYSAENQFIADKMAEAESISARKATLLNPTEDNETVQVLLRRLFGKIDLEKAAPAVEAYRSLWLANKEFLPPDANEADGRT